MTYIDLDLVPVSISLAYQTLISASCCVLLDPGCGRLPVATAITLPLTWFTRTDSIYQLLVDLQYEKALPNWKSVVLICDVQAGDGIIDAVLAGIADYQENREMAVSLYSVDSLSRFISL
jgi:hypothetical protein